MTQECVNNYLDKLEQGLARYMDMPVDMRSSEAVSSMLECHARVKAMQEKLDAGKEDYTFSSDDAKMWCDNMVNSDGTHGGHWTIVETNPFKPDDIEDYVWNVAMNAMYSDYYRPLTDAGVNYPTMYAEMAKAFLGDEDAQANKMARYYHTIVRK